MEKSCVNRFVSRRTSVVLTADNLCLCSVLPRITVIKKTSSKAARTSETLVNFYQTTRCYNPEDSHLHTHRRENLKSYFVIKNIIGFRLYVIKRLQVVGSTTTGPIARVRSRACHLKTAMSNYNTRPIFNTANNKACPPVATIRL
jgi:hypothetical protein